MIEAPRKRWIAAASEARTESGGDAVAFVKMLTGVDGWTLKVEKGNVRVWARSVAGSKFREVRGNGIVDAPPAKVLALLRASDAATIRQYNPMYASGYDLQQLDPNTKVSYGTARKVGPMKPRDTVTRVAFRELPSGGTVLMLRAVDHADKPLSSKYVRARILRGMHLVQPVHGAAGKTNFTFTQQVDCGGALPAWLMNILITQDAVQFIERIGKVRARVWVRASPNPNPNPNRSPSPARSRVMCDRRLRRLPPRPRSPPAMTTLHASGWP